METFKAFAFLWFGFGISWIAAMVWSSRAAFRPGVSAELPYRIVTLLGAVLFFIPAHGYYGAMRLWWVTLTEAWICVALVALGFAFCWWARIYLGKLWSGSVTVKAEHRVVDTGPYRLVRHPIYTGILLAVFATMIAKGTMYGIAGAFLITLGIWMKARLEEGFLRAQLGADAYDSYAARVPMLVPFLRVS